MEKKIRELVGDRGPLTGAELLDALDSDPLPVWRTCISSRQLAMQRAGTRYLRLDRRVPGIARLSPSILREFLTYSAIGLAEEPATLEKKVKHIAAGIEGVSRAKSVLLYRTVSSLETQLESEIRLDDGVCFILGGDIVYNMAHDVPRPERSTGRLVRGSDMDMVVVVDDRFPAELTMKLDDAIYREKYRLLTAPHLREEIDYIVKDLKRVREQARFDTFKHMVACKILHEGALLHGSELLFHRVKTTLREFGVIAKLRAMEEKAKGFRREAVHYLLSEDPDQIKEESLYLFYPTEESEEFE
jgi:hypothetical protein